MTKLRAVGRWAFAYYMPIAVSALIVAVTVMTAGALTGSRLVAAAGVALGLPAVLAIFYADYFLDLPSTRKKALR